MLTLERLGRVEETKNNLRNKKHRLLGIDLLKGIASYAVVYAHSSGRPYGITGYWAAKIGYFSTEFAVHQIKWQKTF